MSLMLQRTVDGVLLTTPFRGRWLPDDWDSLMQREDLVGYLNERLAQEIPPHEQHAHVALSRCLAPVQSQEVWAAGVTYQRSKAARVEESKDAGGSSFYDRVYEAERPELFFKMAGWRVRGPGEPVRIRRDATWSVPEPEIALCLNAHGRVVGYTIGNDMSSRDIEGENPLYLPQAKSYDGACALGPAVLVTDVLPPSTLISMSIERDGDTVFEGTTQWARMKRTPEELAGWLFRECSFPNGCVLLTGTGIVPPDSFTLKGGDLITISVTGLDMLRNIVSAS